MPDWEGFTTRSLEILLECQEYPEGEAAAEIRGLLSWRGGRSREECV